jgi:hypothetical protein
MLRSFLLLCVLLTPAAAADLRCDSPGIAGMVIPDLFAKNPRARKLGLEVTDVRLVGMDGDSCLVDVETNRGHVFKYKFRFNASGAATLDMIP